MTSFLEKDEDILYTANNNLFSKNFIFPLLRDAFERAYSSDVLGVMPITALDVDSDVLRNYYERQVRPYVLDYYSPEETRKEIDAFFMRMSKSVGSSSIGALGKDFDTQAEALVIQNNGKVSLGSFADCLYLKHECLNIVGFIDEYFSRANGINGGCGDEWDYTYRIFSCQKLLIKSLDSIYLHLAYGFTSRCNFERQRAMEINGEKFKKKYDKDESQSICGFDVSYKSTTFDDQKFVMVAGKKLPLLHNIYDTNIDYSYYTKGLFIPEKISV